MSSAFSYRVVISTILLVASAFGPSASGAGIEMFVSPSGDDQDPGTRLKPFATLEQARDRARQARQEQPSVPITVFLLAGDYLRTNALELTQADSGTEQAPTTWQSYSKARARWLGGRSLRGFGPVTDRAILDRLPENARTHVLQLDLRKLGISDFGEMKSRGFGRPVTPAHCELFFSGKPMTLARWPNEGQFEHIEGFPEEGGQNDEHGGKIGKLQNGFFYKGDRPRGWKPSSDIWVHGYWSWDWANSYEHVSELDAEKHWVKTLPPFGMYGFRKGQRFYFLNVLEELDTRGEWYLDHKSGVLYFWPPASLEDNEVILSTLAAPLLKLNSVSHVVFKGLMFEATRGNAVEIRSGATNEITDCLIRDIGDYAVRIDGGSGHAVRGCDIFDTGDGGVSLEGGDRQTLTAAGHVVDNCHFARQGRWSKCYVPAVLMSGVGMRVSHNLIEEHPHCGILFGGNDHLIEFNEIRHVALETGDVGAIYTGRDYTYRGNRIRFNYIHETGGVGMGSMGVYMDDCVSGTEIFGNIFYKVQRAAFLGGGRDHRVINNIFVDCNPAVQVDGRGLDHSPVWHNMVDKTMRDHLKHVPLGLYRERYPEMKSLDAYYGPPEGPAIEGGAFKGVPPEGNVVARNVCVGKWLEVGWHATPETLKIENNLTNAVVGAAGKIPEHPQATDFSIEASSPAWKLGFEKIPLEQIGLRRQARQGPGTG